MKLLVVDDDQELAMLLKMQLEDLGNRVDTSSNGIKGFKLAVGNDYDVIVMDLMLPGMNGLQICEALRKKWVNTPVIMISALDSRDEKVKGLASGADEFLVKPFSLDDLYTRIVVLDRIHNNRSDRE